MTRICGCINCITPPHLLKRLLESKDKDIRQNALSTLMATQRLRGERSIRASFAAAGAPTDRSMDHLRPVEQCEAHIGGDFAHRTGKRRRAMRLSTALSTVLASRGHSIRKISSGTQSTIRACAWTDTSTATVQQRVLGR